MKIENIEIENVLSFKEYTSITLNQDINILVGPNGGGKTNFLSIINTILREYFFHIYTITYSVEDKVYSLNRSAHTPEGIKNILARNKLSNNSVSSISITLLLEESDRRNILDIQKQAEKLIEYIRIKYANSYNFNKLIEMINEIQTMDVSLFNKKTYKFEFQDKDHYFNLEGDTEKKQILNYTNYIEPIIIIASDLGIVLNRCITFLNAHESHTQDVKVSLTQFEFNTTRGLNGSSSSQMFIQQGTLYYAQKCRKAEFDPDLKELYNKEIDNLNRELNQYGFSIELFCNDIYQNSYEFIIKQGEQNFRLSDASTGQIEILNLLLGLISESNNGGVMLVDEPELHLHTTWQKKIYEMIRRYIENKNIQVILATHSPTLINADNLQKIYRLDMKNSNTVITQIDNSIKTKDAYNIINATNNDLLFFAKNVVLVEGITDQLVISRIFKKVLPEGKSDFIEVLSIHGKCNLNKFTTILEQLKVPWVFIGDLDVLIQKGNSVKHLFVTDSDTVGKRVFKSKNSRDLKSLYLELKNAAETGDCKRLQEFLIYIDSRYQKLRKLNLEEQELIKEEIQRLKSESIYILERGDIEDYYSILPKDKDQSLDNAVLLITEKFDKWKVTIEYSELQTLCCEILEWFDRYSVS